MRDIAEVFDDAERRLAANTFVFSDTPRVAAAPKRRVTYIAPRTPEPPRDHAHFIANAEARRVRRNAKRAALIKR